MPSLRVWTMNSRYSCGLVEVLVVSKTEGILLDLSPTTLPVFEWVKLVFDDNQGLVEVVRTDRLMTRMVLDASAVKTQRETKDGLRAILDERITKLQQELESLQIERQNHYSND